MRICVLVPSEDHMHQAGVRIRYRRIETGLQELGHELHVSPVQRFTRPRQLEHDVYIISKCHDARALVVARLLAGSGKLVGVDLFDDYFSQSHDSRLVRLRLWLGTLLRSADFVLCSTPAMGEVAGSLAPELPLHVMNDPSPPFDAGAVGAAVQRKLDHAHAWRTLNLGWFGVGDNPHFPVGLADLAAFGGRLARLRGRGFAVRLDILTNRRAMTADGLAALRRLAVPYALEEWTPEREAALLARSLACFLPVNAQNFSVVKSLNRAVSALAAGAQVLCGGYPLYEPLSPFIYRDPLRLLHDVEARTPALRQESVPELLRLMAHWASPAEEARKLAEFLRSRCAAKSNAAPAARRQPADAVIHGRETLGDIHKFAQRMGVLSVGSPFSTPRLNYDVRFCFAAGASGPDVYVAQKHCPTLEPELAGLLGPHGRIVDTDYRKVAFARLLPGHAPVAMALGAVDSSMAFTAAYANVMSSVEKALRRLFPGVTCCYSEQVKLPWWIEPGRPAQEFEGA